MPDELCEQWLEQLILFTVQQSLHPVASAAVNEVSSDLSIAGQSKVDVDASLREALRRRLDRATPEEQIAASLIQLCAYPAEFVAGLMGISRDAALALAGVIAPPPGVEYRNLGDPELLGSSRAATSSRFRRKPHWTTVVALLLVVLAVFYATQVTGPRPSLTNEGGLGVSSVRVIEETSDHPTEIDRLFSQTPN